MLEPRTPYDAEDCPDWRVILDDSLAVLVVRYDLYAVIVNSEDASLSGRRRYVQLPFDLPECEISP